MIALRFFAGFGSSTRFIVLLHVALVCSAAAGCKCNRNPSRSDEPSSAVPKSNELPKLELKDDTPNLLLTWIDEKGDFHVVQKPAEVPDGRRDKVRVVVTNREDGTGQFVYVADLTKKNGDGTYPVSTLSRAQWEELGAGLRKARLEALAPSASAPSAPAGSAPAGVAGNPPPGTPGALTPGDRVTAIIYGASWCKPCHDAARYLKQRGVTVVDKDIEENPTAASELRSKLAHAGLGTSSIPIIDIMGKILVGYDPRALDRAIEAARNAKAL